MSDKKLYQWTPDIETLKQFYDGKLSKDEHQSMTLLLKEDEFLREAFSGLDKNSILTVEKIAVSVTEKLKWVIAPPPFYMRWKVWLSVFIGLVAISSFVMIYDFNSGDISKTSKALVNEKSTTSTKKNTGDKKGTHNSTLVNSTQNNVETTMMFNSQNESKKINSQIISTDTSKKTKKIIEEKINDAPLENKNEEKKLIVKNENQNTLDPGKKTFKIRLEEAAVMNTENLAEREANSGDNKKDIDVTNPNIGKAVTDKKNTSYNLEDMPYYRGGTESLASFVRGKIAIKTYTSKVQYVSTVVEFVVNSKGNVSDVVFQNPLDAAMEKDIKDVLTNVSFVPGKKSGKKGSMVYQMALMFE